MVVVKPLMVVQVNPLLMPPLKKLKTLIQLLEILLKARAVRLPLTATVIRIARLVKREVSPPLSLLFLFLHLVWAPVQELVRFLPLFVFQQELQKLLLHPGLEYIALGKRRRRHKRADQVRGPAALEEQLFDHVDQADGPHEYTLVKKRRQPRSAPSGRTKGSKKRADHRVCHRTIIDIHLEVLGEYQRENLHSTKEDFFEILVQEFMGSEFIKEENVPEEGVPSSDSGFRVDFRKEQFTEEQMFLRNRFQVQVPEEENFPKELDQSSDSGFRVDVPKEQVPSSDSGFREEDLVPEEGVPMEVLPQENQK
ncbi:SICA antigen [Plasmodium coatneyi]|uniref:SICA antigen n=1 Tax=Plasmodium coatneyi TaxID=208452 RepID=A0A1B1E223_9APIC|nr:SICA antigen [Plasmodium coatneyi]ANQ09082.1 SICA antigen [Plasmodium coatneyi]